MTVGYFRAVLIVCFLSSAAFGSECIATGIAVDSSDRPVPDANVFAHVPPAGWEDLIVTFKATESGAFAVEYPCRSSDATLFVTPNIDTRNNFVPIYPPLYVDRDRFPALAGMKLPWIKNGSLNAGRVRVPTFYERVVQFRDAAGGPFLSRGSKNQVYIRIRPVRGSFLYYGSINQSSWQEGANGVASGLRLMLPEGKWYLDLSLNEDKGPLYTARSPVDFSHPDSQPVVVIIPKDNR